MAEKYNASNIALEQILNFIKSGEIAIPEIQRPFVWKPKLKCTPKVRHKTFGVHYV